MATNNPTCPDCDPKDEYNRCPSCGHNCDMQAKTIHADEDGLCRMCGEECLLSDDGTHMIPHPQGCC